MIKKKQKAIFGSGLNRRDILKNFASIPILGALACGATKKYNGENVNAITRTTIKLNDSK